MKLFAALLVLPALGLVQAAPKAAAACYLDLNAEYVGGNIFDKHSPNKTNAGSDACCQMCQETTGCIFWTLSPTGTGCWGNHSIGCCWLKNAQGLAGRSVKAGLTSGSTKPYPKPPVKPIWHLPARCEEGDINALFQYNGVFLGELCPRTLCHSILPKILVVLVDCAIPPAPAVAASTRISAG